MYNIDKPRKVDLLSSLLRSNADQTLVFSRTKYGANNLVKRLSRDNISAAAIHGNKSQAQRTKALDAFKQNKVQVLVATDIAARGIDISTVTHVINYRVPENSEDYVHRIGRTGRAESEGDAFTILTADELDFATSVENFIDKKIERRKLDNFDYIYTALLDESPAKSVRKKRRPAPKRRRR